MTTTNTKRLASPTYRDGYKVERRFFPAAVEHRQSPAGAIDATSAGYVVGVAVVYNEPSLDLGGFVELMRDGCFTDALEEYPDVLALAHHDHAKPLGRVSAGTLALRDRHEGLAFGLDIAPTTDGVDVFTSITRGDLRGMSFGFTCTKETWSVGPDGVDRRHVVSAILWELSVVSMPAYVQTSVRPSKRSASETAEARRFMEACRERRIQQVLEDDERKRRDDVYRDIRLDRLAEQEHVRMARESYQALKRREAEEEREAKRQEAETNLRHRINYQNARMT